MVHWLVTETKALWGLIQTALTTEFLKLGGQSISLAFLLKVGLAIAAVLLVARLLSQVFKLLILRRLLASRGTQESVTTIINYLLATLGCLIVLQATSIDLRSLAVIAGALSIGLGIGLQTLANQFVCGLILLLEQTIKVGDVVEVEGLMGTVEQISTRSTTVKTIDGISVILPNNSFVEQKVINWSHGDARSCLHLPIAVVHGTDPLLVIEALTTAARKEPRVLSQPTPQVWLKAFTENGIDFELLVWIKEPIESSAIKSSLNFLVESEFRFKGIEMPANLQELYLRTLGYLQQIQTQYELPRPAPEISTSKFAPQIETFRNPVSKQKSSKATHNLRVSEQSNLQDLLRQVCFFEHCSDRDIRQLIELGYRQRLLPNQILFQEGEEGDEFYIILAGKLEVYSERLQIPLATREKGDFLGEMSLFLGIPRSATIRAIEPSIVFVLDRDNLQTILANQQALADRISEEIVKRKEELKRLGITLNENLNSHNVTAWVRKRIGALFAV